MDKKIGPEYAWHGLVKTDEKAGASLNESVIKESKERLFDASSAEGHTKKRPPSRSKAAKLKPRLILKKKNMLLKNIMARLHTRVESISSTISGCLKKYRYFDVSTQENQWPLHQEPLFISYQ